MKITELQATLPNIYNTDKFGFSNKWTSHAYGDYYDNLFEPIKNKELNILEIGIYNGGSVRLFHDYLTKSHIYGVDIADYWNGGNLQEYPRLNRFFGNAYNIEYLLKILPMKFDVIIDDGPHTVDSQIYFVENMISLLKPNGILVLEDVVGTTIPKITSHIKNNYMVHNWINNGGKLIDDVIIEIKND